MSTVVFGDGGAPAGQEGPGDSRNRGSAWLMRLMAKRDGLMRCMALACVTSLAKLVGPQVNRTLSTMCMLHFQCFAWLRTFCKATVRHLASGCANCAQRRSQFERLTQGP